MSVYLRSRLSVSPGPKLGVPFAGSIEGVVQGGSTGAITFDVYTGGAGPVANTAVVVQSAIGIGAWASDALGYNSDWAHGAIGLRSYAETGAPSPPYTDALVRIALTSQSVVHQELPDSVQDVVSFLDTVAATAEVYASLSDGVRFTDMADPISEVQLADTFSVASVEDYGVLCSTVSAFGVSDDAAAAWIQVLRDALRLAADDAASYDSHKVVVDSVMLSERLASIVRMALSDSFSATDEPSSWLGVALALRDGLRFGAPTGATYDVHTAVVATFALRELIQDAQRGILVDDVSLTEALVARITAIQQMLDSLEIQAATDHTALLHAVLSDTTTFTDSVTEYLAIKKALLDGAQFGLTLYTGQDTYTAWVMTPETRAMRRYLNYPFNSFAELGGRICGASSDGIYLLEGDDDAGVSIKAAVRTGLLDFGLRQLKRMDRAYLGYASDGTLCLRVINTSETGAKMECTYKMVERTAVAPREQRIPVGRGLQSVYWQFELTNEEGSDFELHDMTLLPMVLSRRVRS